MIEQPGFVLAHWDGTRETEDKIQEETKATIRCIPDDDHAPTGPDVLSGAPGTCSVLYARAY